MLKPTWASSAEFIGEEVFDGHSAYRWNQRGIQSNFLVETNEAKPSDRKILLIDQQPQDYTHFHHDTFTRHLDDADLEEPEGMFMKKRKNMG